MNIIETLAIYAASLSTLNFLWNMGKSRAHFTVELVPGSNHSGSDFQLGVYLEIKNPSAQTVHITSASLLYPYKTISFYGRLKYFARHRSIARYVGWVHNPMVFEAIETGLPVSIEARKSHLLFLPSAVIRKMLGEANVFAALVHDGLWNRQYSRPFTMFEETHQGGDPPGSNGD